MFFYHDDRHIIKGLSYILILFIEKNIAVLEKVKSVRIYIYLIIYFF